MKNLRSRLRIGAPIRHLGVIRSIPRDFGVIVSQPIVKISCSRLNLTAIGKGNVAAGSVDEVVDPAKSNRALLFYESYNLLDERITSKAFPEVRI